MEDIQRAEEVLLALWKKIREMRDAREVPERILLGPHYYRLIQSYRARLGDLPNPAMDYITRDSIFNLPIFLDEDALFEVQAK